MSKEFFKLDKKFDRWLEWLKTCEKSAVQDMESRIVRTAGLRGLEYAKDLTPRRSGRLENSLQFGTPENYFKLEVGKTTFVVYGTTVDYAAAVEEGFSQEKRKGKFIPGYWASGTFHYQPGAKTGMVLTGKVIEGAHMLEKSLDYLRDDMEDIVLYEFRRLYAMLFER